MALWAYLAARLVDDSSAFRLSSTQFWRCLALRSLPATDEFHQSFLPNRTISFRRASGLLRRRCFAVYCFYLSARRPKGQARAALNWLPVPAK